MNNFEIVINWSKEDNCFIAAIPELEGCIAHGETEEIALKNILDAKQLWLETAKEFNDEIPEPKNKLATA